MRLSTVDEGVCQISLTTGEEEGSRGVGNREGPGLIEVERPKPAITPGASRSSPQGPPDVRSWEPESVEGKKGLTGKAISRFIKTRG